MQPPTLRFTPGDLVNGPHVRNLQSTLVMLGFDIGEFGADGWFGDSTHWAVRAFQAKAGLLIDGVVGPKTWEALEKEAISTAGTAPGGRKLVPEGFVDRRGLHDHPALYSAHRTPRAWSGIKGVTLHQTGCLLSDRPTRWDSVGAHIGVTRSGVIVLMNELTDFIWHGQGLSHHTIGIEISGNFHGLECRDWTVWKGGGGPHTLTDAQCKALNQRLLPWLRDQFDENGQRFEVVRAHRQSSGSRQSDPGEEIWRTVGLTWIDKLGIEQDPGWRTGSGRPIPEDWGGASGVAF